MEENSIDEGIFSNLEETFIHLLTV